MLEVGRISDLPLLQRPEIKNLLQERKKVPHWTLSFTNMKSIFQGSGNIFLCLSHCRKSFLGKGEISSFSSSS